MGEEFKPITIQIQIEPNLAIHKVVMESLKQAVGEFVSAWDFLGYTRSEIYVGEEAWKE